MSSKQVLQKTPNECLWLLKGLSCIIVILFHCPIHGIIGDAIIYGLRFPIPIFFMISGYFFFLKDNYIYRIKKLLFILIFAAIIFFLCYLLGGAESVNPFSTLKSLNPIKTVFFGSLFNPTLWYLYAMIWSCILFYMFSLKASLFHIAYIAIVPLLLFHILGRMFVQAHYDINLYVYIFRSALLYAVPFLLIGRLIAEYENVILRRLTNKKILLLFFIGLIVMVTEYVIFCQYMDLQFSTIFISLGLFLFALKNPHFSPIPFLTDIGRKVSLYVYIFHMPIIVSLKTVFSNYAPEINDSNLLPFLTIITTLFVSYTYYNIKVKK